MDSLADDTMSYGIYECHPNTVLPSEESGNSRQRAAPTYDEPVVSSGGISAFHFDPSLATTSAYNPMPGNANISSNIWSTENTSQRQPVAHNSKRLISPPAQQMSHIWTDTAATVQGSTPVPYINTDKTLFGGPGISANSHVNADDETFEALAMPIAPSAPQVPSVVLTSASYIAPARKNVARRTEEDWTTHRHTIKSLYMDRNMTLDDTMRTMGERHGFFASQKKYKEKLKNWGFEKNLTSRQTKFITRKALRRWTEEGKKTEFRVKGNRVPSEKVERHLKAKTDCLKSPTSSVPSGMSYNTLRPSSRSLVSPGGLTPGSPRLVSSPLHSPQVIGNATSQPQLSQQRRSMTSSGSDILRLEWHGYDLDALRDLCRRAVKSGEDGDIDNARIMFLESLDGLEALVGSCHYLCIEALSSFVRFCLSNDFHDEAEDKMKKSLIDHQLELGDDHEQTLQSAASLGHFFFLRGKNGNSEILLTRARTGLYNLYKSNAESALLNTLQISEDLIEIYKRYGESTKAEQELLHMIETSKTAEGPNGDRVLTYKHDLAHLYLARLRSAESGNNGYLLQSGPFMQAENLLLEIIDSERLTNRNNLCVYEMLREWYHTRNEDTQLRAFLARIESDIILVPAHPVTQERRMQLCELKAGLGHSHTKLGNFEHAEWWYLHVQEEIEQHFGAESYQAFENVVQTAFMYLRQNNWEDAEPLFRHALRLTEVVLEQGDPKVTRIAQCLITQEYEGGCSCCGI
ncbi:MAG: hypothetical protein M1836_008187 [Candelina mexicana]|nr:MAG: hypothetical protein M1836_008187 [Candelina mexicana]